jgi:hypothetical protein
MVWSRVLKETWHWGKEQVLVILLAIATLALQIREGLVRSGDWKPSVIATVAPYLVYAVVFLLYQFVRAQRLLYAELQLTSHNTEESLRAVTAERDALKEPKRTAAEQNAYETVERALKVVGTKGITALRFLRTHGIITFNLNSCSVPLPPELSIADALRIYRHCLSEGVVTSKTNLGNSEEIFMVPVSMEKALAALLY